MPTQTLQIPVLVTVPNAKRPRSARLDAAAGGWPVLIFQHGITRSREDMFGVADSFADAGFVVVAIDLPLHGVTSTDRPPVCRRRQPAVRGPRAARQRLDRAHLRPRRREQHHGARADGLIDPSGSHFINLTSLLTSRDNLREGVADLITLARTLPQLSLGAAGGINAAAIHYLGHSLGAIVGGTFMGVVRGPRSAPRRSPCRAAASRSCCATRRPSRPRSTPGLEAQGLQPGTTLYEQFFRDAQTVVDSGDPHQLHRTRHHAASDSPDPGGGQRDLAPGPGGAELRHAAPHHGIGLRRRVLTRIPAPAAPGVVTGGAGAPPGLRAYVNFIAGDHGSIIDPTASPAVTTEMQARGHHLHGRRHPARRRTGDPPGTTMLIANPTVIQP